MEKDGVNFVEEADTWVRCSSKRHFTSDIGDEQPCDSSASPNIVPEVERLVAGFPLSRTGSPMVVSRRSSDRALLTGIAPDFDLHDPLMQQFLLFDANVRRSAQSAITYLRGHGVGKSSYSRSAARMVRRTASFSREAVFGTSTKSVLCKTLVREEHNRSSSFEAALHGHTLREYADCLITLVKGLAAISSASRRLRRSVFLAEYSNMLEQHLSICLSLMGSLAEAPGSTGSSVQSSSNPALAGSPVRDLSCGASKSSSTTGSAGDSPQNSPCMVLSMSVPSLLDEAVPNAHCASNAGIVGPDGNIDQEVGQPKVEDGGPQMGPFENEAEGHLNGTGSSLLEDFLGSPKHSTSSIGSHEPLAMATHAQYPEVSSEDPGFERNDAIAEDRSVFGADSHPAVLEAAGRNSADVVDWPTGSRPKVNVLFAEDLPELTNRQDTSTPSMHNIGETSEDKSLLEASAVETLQYAQSQLHVTPIVAMMTRSSSLPSEDAMLESGASAERVSADTEAAQVEFSCPAGVSNAGRKGHYVSEPPAFAFRVRGPDYLSTKAKVPCDWAALTLLGVDLQRAKQKQDHVAEGAYSAKMAQLREVYPGREFLIINFQCPSRAGGSVSVVLWWAMSERAQTDAKFMALWRQMMDVDDDKWRGARLKLIPCVVEGNFIVRKLVGSRPVLIKAIKTKYYTGPGYFEVNADIVSSSMATNMWRGVESAARGLVVDLGFVLEVCSLPVFSCIILLMVQLLAQVHALKHAIAPIPRCAE